LLWKILTRLHGTNFCTTSRRFAPSFVRQPNGTKCTQIVRNTPKQEFGVQWSGSVAFVEKNSNATSWHELLHQFGLFCTVFCNTTERSQMHQNSMKRYETWVLGPMGWIGCVRCEKILTRLHGTNFCTTSAHFAPSFVRQPNGPKCIQRVRNTPKREFRGQWGGSGAFITKNSDATSWHELLHQVVPFCTECCNASKLSQMHPNSMKCTKT
jgi:hypothetical protein